MRCRKSSRGGGKRGSFELPALLFRRRSHFYRHQSHARRHTSHFAPHTNGSSSHTSHSSPHKNHFDGRANGFCLRLSRSGGRLSRSGGPTNHFSRHQCYFDRDRNHSFGAITSRGCDFSAVFQRDDSANVVDETAGSCGVVWFTLLTILLVVLIKPGGAGVDDCNQRCTANAAGNTKCDSPELIGRLRAVAFLHSLFRRP